jgi:hypothetical protein
MISETEGTTEGRPSYEDCQERPFHARGAQVRVADGADFGNARANVGFTRDQFVRRDLVETVDYLLDRIAIAQSAAL